MNQNKKNIIKTIKKRNNPSLFENKLMENIPIYFDETNKKINVNNNTTNTNNESYFGEAINATNNASLIYKLSKNKQKKLTYLEKIKTKYLKKGLNESNILKILKKHKISDSEFIDLSDIDINSASKRHENINLILENNEKIKKFKTKKSHLNLPKSIIKENIVVFKQGSTLDLTKNSKTLNADEGFYVNLTDIGDDVLIKTNAGNFSVKKITKSSYKLSGYPFLNIKHPSTKRTIWKDNEKATVNGISLHFGGLGGNGGNDNEGETSTLYLPVYLDSSKNVLDTSTNAVETLDSSFNFTMVASSFTASKLSQFIKFKKNGDNYTYKFDTAYDTIVKNAIRQDLVNQLVNLRNSIFVSGSHTHQSTLGGYFVQYVSDIIMGHPQAQMFIKNDQAMINSINESNLNEQFNNALKTNLTSTSFNYNDICDSILRQLISEVPDRFTNFLDDTEYDIPYQTDDLFVIFFKISGNIDLEERSSSNIGDLSNYNILKNLYSSNIYLTFDDAAQNIKTNESIWRLIIQLA